MTYFKFETSGQKVMRNVTKTGGESSWSSTRASGEHSRPSTSRFTENRAACTAVHTAGAQRALIARRERHPDFENRERHCNAIGKLNENLVALGAIASSKTRQHGCVGLASLSASIFLVNRSLFSFICTAIG
jgi:hypothetical protein